MKKSGNAQSGGRKINEPIEFRGMGEGAIEALVGKEGLAKLKRQMKEADKRYEIEREAAKQMIRNGTTDEEVIKEIGFGTSIGVLRDEVGKEARK